MRLVGGAVGLISLVRFRHSLRTGNFKEVSGCEIRTSIQQASETSAISALGYVSAKYGSVKMIVALIYARR
jgi:hypothetical protein